MDPPGPAWTLDALHEAQVVATRFHILQSQSLLTFLYPVLSGAALAVLLWPLAPRGVLVIWLGLLLTLTLARCAMLVRARIHPDPAHAGEWLTLFAVGACLSGLLWGAAPMLLVPPMPDRAVEFTLCNGFVTLLICGLAAGATVSYACSMRVLLCYIIPALVLPGCYLISLGDRLNGTLGGFVLLYFVFIGVAGLRMNMQLRRFLDMEYRLHLLQEDLRGAACERSGCG